MRGCNYSVTEKWNYAFDKPTKAQPPRITQPVNVQA
jgi:hypothetical protein